MPVTKKPGAVFAIYADSPAHTSHPTTRSTTSPNKRRSPPKPIMTAQAVSPLSRDPVDMSVPFAKRKVLVVKQAKARPSIGLPSDPLKKRNVIRASPFEDPSKPSAIMDPSVHDKENRPSKPNGSEEADNEPTIRALKKPTRPSTAMEAEAPVAAVRAAPLQRKPSRKQQNIFTPLRSDVFIPNASPADSPASRTRSKASPRIIPSTANQLDSILREAGDRADDIKDLAAFVGDGKHFMKGKMMRHVAAMLEDPEMECVMLGATEMRKSGSGSKGSRPWARGDQPLSDVSEAYGASGITPSGWEQQNDGDGGC